MYAHVNKGKKGVMNYERRSHGQIMKGPWKIAYRV
jgi:hypothetical protein